MFNWSSRWVFANTISNRVLPGNINIFLSPSRTKIILTSPGDSQKAYNICWLSAEMKTFFYCLSEEKFVSLYEEPLTSFESNLFFIIIDIFEIFPSCFLLFSSSSSWFNLQASASGVGTCLPIPILSASGLSERTYRLFWTCLHALKSTSTIPQLRHLW